MEGQPVTLASHGVHVFIIDFTNSRSIQGILHFIALYAPFPI